eukprot:GHVQ01039244.1.p3 GENE.GHVQ01039244.1~~GHVQ01039244.1.p3  ORF type:complete len:114 (+),score=2.50 GHVQ01039244.1:1766-2107(+)
MNVKTNEEGRIKTRIIIDFTASGLNDWRLDSYNRYQQCFHNATYASTLRRSSRNTGSLHTPIHETQTGILRTTNYAMDLFASDTHQLRRRFHHSRHHATRRGRGPLHIPADLL